jgi:hypothetical protein
MGAGPMVVCGSFPAGLLGGVGGRIEGSMEGRVAVAASLSGPTSYAYSITVLSGCATF